MPTEHRSLASLAIGGLATVTEIKVPPEHRARLLEMGLLVGTTVELVRFAPDRDIKSDIIDVGFVPKADIATHD